MTDRVSAFNELLKAGCLAYNRLCRDYDDVEKGLNTYLDAVLAIRLSRSSVERQRGILSFVETMVRLEDMETWVDERHDFEEITDDFLQTAFLLKVMPSARRTTVIAVTDVMRELQIKACVTVGGRGHMGHSGM